MTRRNLRHGGSGPARSRWAARLAAWLCLLALSFHQVVPPALAELAVSRAADANAFICHAGAPADHTPAQPGDDDFGCCGHCPLCQLLHAPAFVPPARIGLAITAPPAFALLRPAVPADRRPAWTAAFLTPLHPRAPPVAV